MYQSLKIYTAAENSNKQHVTQLFDHAALYFGVEIYF